jgi:translation initiation factor 2B subunit (eIF-2B alpha/beta/delta family)
MRFGQTLLASFQRFIFFVIRVFRFLTQCRPLSVSMGNAIKFLKLQITQIPPSMSEKQVSQLVSLINVTLLIHARFESLYYYYLGKGKFNR